MTTETARVIESLSHRLSLAHSATSVLEAWCAERGLGADPCLAARRVACPDKTLDDAQRARLAVAGGETVLYRRVRLSCGPHVLSEADNWYVPGRLAPGMKAVLESTDTPFGRVVRPLSPIRRTLSVDILWPSADRRIPVPGDALLSVRALLSRGDGVPFCEVAEVYTGAILASGRP